VLVIEMANSWITRSEPLRLSSGGSCGWCRLAAQVPDVPAQRAEDLTREMRRRDGGESAGQRWLIFSP
jgi:hypothetical protein